MPKVKKLNFVVQYGDSGYYVNDLGEDKLPRFELYDDSSKKAVMKSNNPVEFDEWLKKNIWKEHNFEMETDNWQ